MSAYAYTPESLGELWEVSSATVRNLVRAGELRAFRIGRQIRIRPEWADAYKAGVHAGQRPRPTVECGVYLLKANVRVVYVGRSSRLPARLSEHRRSGRPFDEIDVIPCDEPTSVWLERELIRTLNPEQNQQRYTGHALRQARAIGDLP